ncbi:MAG: hypothetical protein LAO79_27405, partial [Acidobacteriia bacterium]|nr:hypothetical protein [Terriglobia bacterium]
QTLTAQPVAAPVAASTTRTAVEPAKAEKTEKQIESRPRPMAAPKERKRTASADAIAAMERGAAMAGAPRPNIAAEKRAERHVERPVETKPAPAPAPVIDVTPEPAHRPVAVAVTPARKDWKSLLNRTASEKKTVEVRTDLMEAVAAATLSQRTQEASTEFPAGFHDGFILSQLVQSRKPVSGLVVSIGVNAPRNEDGSLEENVRGLIQSLIGPSDFACQSSQEEFLLIYPGERGAAAQRKLSQIAQQLWDFQLRSLGEASILFCWGGVEVRSESIDEAIASANERMQETRRGRKLLTMEPRTEQALRQAV